MPISLRRRLASYLLGWIQQLYDRSEIVRLPRRGLHLLLFFHGYSLAHTIRPLVIARVLRKKGYQVEFAGVGPHRELVVAEKFPIHDLETLPQSRMDEYVARGNYAYYDMEWIDRCVRAERALICQLQPDLCLADLRPTLRLSAALEGVAVALIEAGYNQPDYPFPIYLPKQFSLSAGPFDKYLKQQGACGKSHSLLYIVADVPEFHPSGLHTPSFYHYVGPLIEDDLPEPRTIPALTASGWDTSLPLIYLNCGSTGADPAFLGPLLQDLASAPYRVLVTTAGRYSGTSPSPNIRLVDFLPAAWIMRRAALFVGIGGIGSIYHALRQSVPIIGAPEHLDQEYHLNRVQDLGLGLKLSWEAFHRPGELLSAVQTLFARYAEFRQRCQAFSGYVRRWKGGEAAADVIDRFFLDRQSSYSIGAEYLISESDFIRQLEVSTPGQLTADDLRTWLHENLARGLPHRRQRGRLYFDQRDSWNWLYDHEPRFFEADYRALEQKRQQFFCLNEGRLQPRRERQRYRLTYRYRLFPSSLPAAGPARLFLPYPLSTAYQDDIRLGDCYPEDLPDYLLPGAGFFYAYPFAVPDGVDTPLTFTYACEATVAARHLKPAPSPQTLSRREHRRYTAIDPELAASGRIRNFYESLSLPPTSTPFEKARGIYLYLAQQKRFKKTRERCQCPACSTQLILSDTGGHCVTLTHAFMALCRLQGIPCREVTGALAGYPAGEGRFAMGAYNEGLLWGHTWAEVFTGEHGWIPVEFHGIVIAAGALTGENVADPVLRDHITQQGDRYLDYYFGHLDCHRVVCSNLVKKLPHILIREVTPSGRGEWIFPQGLSYECNLIFECL